MDRDDMAEDKLDLAEAIDAVRRELGRAQDAGRDADVRFSVGEVEVEFVVEVVKKGGGEASVRVFGILSVGGKGEVSRGLTNRIKVVLNPIGVDGKPLEVASAQDRRPDAEGSAQGSPAGGRPGG